MPAPHRAVCSTEAVTWFRGQAETARWFRSRRVQIPNMRWNRGRFRYHLGSFAPLATEPRASLSSHSRIGRRLIVTDSEVTENEKETHVSPSITASPAIIWHDDSR